MRPIIETINSIIGGQSGSPQYQELIKKAYQDPEVQSFLREHRAELTDEQIAQCDFDFDGHVTVMDTTCMQKYLVY